MLTSIQGLICCFRIEEKKLVWATSRKLESHVQTFPAFQNIGEKKNDARHILNKNSISEFGGQNLIFGYAQSGPERTPFPESTVHLPSAPDQVVRNP